MDACAAVPKTVTTPCTPAGLGHHLPRAGRASRCSQGGAGQGSCAGSAVSTRVLPHTLCPLTPSVPSDTQNGHSTPCAEGGASPAGLDQPPGQMPSEVLPTGCCCAPSPVGVRRLPLSWKAGRPLPRGSPTSPQTGLATVSRADLCPRPKGRALKEVTELKSGHPNVTVDPANVLLLYKRRVRYRRGRVTAMRGLGGRGRLQAGGSGLGRSLPCSRLDQ